MQIPGRTPANCAMTAMTLDQLSGGRFLLGLGTSGPQVVEGWHGEPWGKPLAKTREYVEIVRTALRARDARAPRRALRHPVLGRRRDRPRQAAEADGAAAARRRSRSTSRRSGRRRSRSRRRSPTAGSRSSSTRRRPARSSATAFERDGFDIAPSVPVVLDRRRQAGPGRRSSRTTRSTSAAWARAARTSTTRSSRRYGFEAEAQRRSRICSSTGSSATRPRPCRTRSSTASRSSARRSGSPSGSRRSARRARRRCSARPAT